MLAALILYISSVSLHLENRPMFFFFLTYHFICPLKKKRKSEEKNGAFKTKYTVVYLCLIPMQYGVKSYSRY